MIYVLDLICKIARSPVLKEVDPLVINRSADS